MASEQYYNAVISSKSKRINELEFENKGLKEINEIYAGTILMLLDQMGGSAALSREDFKTLADKYSLESSRDDKYYFLNLKLRKLINCCVES